MMLEENGVGMKGGMKKVGEWVGGYRLGLRKRFNYKGLRLRLLIDGKIGGEMYCMRKGEM